MLALKFCHIMCALYTSKYIFSYVERHVYLHNLLLFCTNSLTISHLMYPASEIYKNKDFTKIRNLKKNQSTINLWHLFYWLFQVSELTTYKIIEVSLCYFPHLKINCGIRIYQCYNVFFLPAQLTLWFFLRFFKCKSLFPFLTYQKYLFGKIHYFKQLKTMWSFYFTFFAMIIYQEKQFIYYFIFIPLSYYIAV